MLQRCEPLVTIDLLDGSYDPFPYISKSYCEVPMWVSTGCSAWRALGAANTVTRVP